jgi:hypothetical protein
MAIQVAFVRFRQNSAKEGGTHMITLNLRFPRPLVEKTLCTGCIYSHVVRGFEPREDLIFCGYAFPQRAILFRVRECTDFRRKRVDTPETAVVRA